MNAVLKKDLARYPGGRMPKFQKYYRLCQGSKGPMKLLYRLLHRLYAGRDHIEIYPACRIGEGLYVGHPYCITVNPRATIGKNCNIHKGAAIGAENRGSRMGTPTIGDCVWIGINAVIVGNITVGDDVLIAPNTYVNCDIPSHSVVFGNPCVIKHRENATEGYINNRV